MFQKARNFLAGRLLNYLNHPKGRNTYAHV